MACNYGLLRLIHGLLSGIVACYFGLLGVPTRQILRALPRRALSRKLSEKVRLGCPGPHLAAAAQGRRGCGQCFVRVLAAGRAPLTHSLTHSLTD